jgi:eukaryotic-like serine/threonine-protein kinase
MNFFKFLITKTFWRHFLLAAAISLVIFLGTLLWLKIYTHHGQAISVPNLTGLTEDEVEDVVSSRRLRYEIIDSIFSTEMPRGTVLKQNPKPGSKVKVNRRLFITMNAVNLEMVSMPYLVDLSDRQAFLALNNAGLVVGDISFRPDYAVNSVLQQMYKDSVIDEGTLITKGSKIDLVLGMGLSNETTLVPDLVGFGLPAAKSTIVGRFLNMGMVTYDESVLSEEDSAQALVHWQYPEYDGHNRINKGMDVDIWLTVDSTLLPVDSTLLETISEVENEDF